MKQSHDFELCTIYSKPDKDFFLFFTNLVTNHGKVTKACTFSKTRK